MQIVQPVTIGYTRLWRQCAKCSSVFCYQWQTGYAGYMEKYRGIIRCSCGEWWPLFGDGPYNHIVITSEGTDEL